MWPGFDGRAYTRAQWVAHVAGCDLFPAARRIVEHATGIPTLAQWLAFDEHAYIVNAQAYYENSLRWAHGPHVFASFRDIIGFSALTARGTHASCFNADSFGLECGINRNTEDWTSGPGADALANQHFAIAVLMVKMAIRPTPETYLPHSACADDGHSQCPIEDFEAHREAETAAIVAFMNTLGDKLTADPALAALSRPLYAADAAAPVGSTAWLQAELNSLGALPALAIDGQIGAATERAIEHFQRAHGLFIDGIAGPQTIAALEAA